MEVVAVIVVIAVLCLVLGVKPIYLAFAAAALISAMAIISVLMLMYFFVRLLFAKKHKAVFSRIDKSPVHRFKVAYYTIDGEEYPNIFPEEGFLHNILYRSDRSSTVYLTRSRKFVYDKFACLTCTVGTLTGLLFGAAVLYILY